MNSGIRQILDQRKNVLMGLAVGAIVVSSGFTLYHFARGDAGTAGQVSTMYFTVDNGKTFFADDSSKLPPFDHEGKQAVRARVFESSNGVRFVNHLERYPATVRDAASPTNAREAMGGEASERIEVKKAGAPDSAWVNINTDAGRQVLAVTSPPEGATPPFGQVLP
jgi:hypothetical protein